MPDIRGQILVMKRLIGLSLIIWLIFGLIWLAECEEGVKPDWWDSVEVSVSGSSANAQYNYIMENYFRKALSENEVKKRTDLLRKTIKSFSNLTNQFQEESKWCVGAQLHIGDSYTYFQDDRRAIVAYQKVIENYPDWSDYSAQAQSNIGKCYERLGNYNRAIEEYKRCIEDYSGISREMTALCVVRSKNGIQRIQQGEPEFEYLMSRLKSSDSSGRRGVLYELLTKSDYLVGDRLVIDVAIETLKDKTGRQYAARLLGRIAHKEAVEPLIQALKDTSRSKDVLTQQYIASALGSIGDARAVPYLLKMLNNQDHRLRCSAVRSLGAIGDRRAIKPIVKILRKDKSSSVQETAADALGQIKGSAPFLLPILLKDKDFRIRALAGKALSRSSDKTMVPALLKALKEDNPKVRRCIIAALGNIGDTQAVKPLIGIVEDKDTDVDVARTAVYALRRIGNKEAISALTKMLKNSDKNIRNAAACQLKIYEFRK